MGKKIPLMTTNQQMNDPRPAFGAAVRIGGRVMAAVQADQMTDPTPCAAFSVRDLMTHMVTVLRRVAGVGRGLPPLQPQFTVVGASDDGLQALWDEAARDVEAVWSGDGVLERTLTLPFGQFAGAQALAIYTGEVTLHTWDLARATAQEPSWDDQVVALADAALRRVLPGEGRLVEFERQFAQLPPEHRPSAPFGEARPVGPGASGIDRLVAFSGRRP
jgi:uncharacterized protein (TIGR03086 family)